MKYSQQMFNYGDGRYRFISEEPLEVGDEVYVHSKKEPQKIKKIISIEKDEGVWVEEKLSIVVEI